MSKTVDSRVVEMRFDNQQFEQNARTTMSTLDKLKAKLNFKGTADGLSEVNQVANETNLNPLVNAVATVESKFSAMQVVAITALVNITNSAINTGKQLIKSLSIDQVTAGWTKYGQKTASVQTIMNATGKSIDEVNTYLDKLMWFSDETSYGFTDMTQALGQLTSAGGDIDKLIPMIEGIANATAYAGKGTGEFSRAIYNLNQSYSTGNLQYTDWESLELAGIASKELKQTFIDTGIALGKIKEGEVTIANFGKTLSSKWATTEVMEKAFGSFAEMTEKAYEMVNAGEAETASEAYEILAKEYDNVAMKAARSAQEAKTFTEALESTKDAVSSGFLKTFEIIFGNYEEAKVLWTELANRLWDAFASGAEARNNILQTWKDLGGRTKLIESLWKIWDNVASVLGTVKEAFREIFPPMTAAKLYDITKAFSELVDRMKPSEELLDKLKRTFKGVFAAVDIVKQLFSAFISSIFPSFSSGAGTIIDKLLGFTASIGDGIVKLRNFIIESKIFNNIFGAVARVINSVCSNIKKFISLIKSKIGTPGLELISALFERIKERAKELSGIGERFKNSPFISFLSKMLDLLKKIGSSILNKLSGIISDIGQKIKDAKFSDILDVLNGILLGGIGVGIASFLNNIKEKFDAFDTIKDAAMGVIKSLAAPFNALADVISSFKKKFNIEALEKIAKSIAILVASLFVLSLIDSVKLTIAVGAITSLFTELLGSLKIFTMINKDAGEIRKASSTMIAISSSILILAIAVKTLGKLKWDQMIKGVLAVAALLTMAIGVAKALSSENDAKMMKGVGSLITLSIAMTILARVVKKLGSLDIFTLGKGLIGIGAILGALYIFASKVKFDSEAFKNLTGIMIFSIAISTMSKSVSKLGEMDFGKLIKGLIGLAGILATIAIFVNKTEANSDLMKTATAMVVMCVSIKLLASTVQKLGSLSLPELAKGLISLAVGLGIMVGAMALLGKIEGDVKSVIAISLMSVALLIMSGALKVLAAIPLGKIAKGLLGLVGAFLVLGIAGVVLGALAPVILILTAAIALMGVGMLACAEGVLKFVLALTAFMAIGEGAVGVLVAGMSAIVIGLASLIPIVVKAIAEGFVQVIETIGQNATEIGESILKLIVSFCDMIIQAMPKIIETIGVVLDGIITLLVEYIPKLANAALDMLVGILEALATHIEDVVKLAIDIVVGFIEGLASKMPDIIQAAFDLMISFIEGLAEALNNNTERMTNAAWDLVEAFIKSIFTAVTTSFDRIKELGEELMESNFIQGIKDKVKGIWENIVDGIKTAIEKIKEKWNDFKSAGKNLIDGLKEGILGKFEDMWSSVKDACGGLIDKVKGVFGINSPSKVFEEIGGYLDKGLALGIDKFSKFVNQSGENMCVDLMDTVQDGLGDMSNITDGIDANPTITPVLDLSKIEEGAKRITGIFSNRQAIYAAAEGAASREAKTTGTTINMTINASEGQDVRQLADIISERINNSVRRTEYAWK